MRPLQQEHLRPRGVAAKSSLIDGIIGPAFAAAVDDLAPEIIDKAFYPTALETKLEALRVLADHHAKIDLTHLLDRICDGAGGCERLTYSTPDGGTWAVSVLAQPDSHRTSYVVIETTPDGRLSRFEFSTWSNLGDMAVDSIRRYADVLDGITDDWED